MKKQSLLIFTAFMAVVFVLSLMNLQAGSPRKVLSEEGTSWTCPPCGQLNPAYEAYLQNNLDKIVPIAFHQNYPAPGDSMYINDPKMNDQRIQRYYGINSIPTVVIQGNQFKSQPVQASVDPIVQAIRNGSNSPITLKVTQKVTGLNVDVTVEITSDSTYTNYKLYACAVETYHHWDPAGTNGENDFFFIARKMLPDSNGLTVMLPAGVKITKTFSYTIKNNWNASLMYTAAWFQNDATKEILQAESSPIPSAVSLTASIENPFTKIPPNAMTKQKITLTNPYDFDVNADLTVSPKSDKPDDWTISLEKTNVTVPANQTLDVYADVTTSDVAYCATVRINVEIKNNQTGTYPIVVTAPYLALSTNTKNVIWFGTAGASPSYTSGSIHAYSEDFFNKTALVYIGYMEPLAQGGYNVNDFDLGIFEFSYNNSAIMQSQNDPDIADRIQQMIDNNKKVILTGDLLLASSHATPNQSTTNLFTNTFGIDVSGNPIQRFTTVVINGNTYINGFTKFPITGVAGDDIGNGMSLQGNYITSATAQSVGRFSYGTDLIKILPSSESNYFLYYDNDPSRIAGVHLEKLLSRAIYLTFNIGALDVDSERDALVAKMLDWLKNAPTGAAISSDLKDVNFLSPTKNVTNNLPIDVYNRGNADLVISKYDLDQPLFLIDASNTYPVTIHPDEKITLMIHFTPTATGSYSGTLKITSNAINDPKYKINIYADVIAGTGPQIETDCGALLDFSAQKLKQKSFKDIIISNNGTQPLHIKNAILFLQDSNDSGAFDVESGYEVGTLPVGKTRTLTISFYPLDTVVYNGKFIIETDAKNNPNYTISVTGKGLAGPNSVTDPALSSGILTMGVSPNPIIESGAVNYSISGNETVEINLKLMDATGRTVSLIASGFAAPGDYRYNILASTYASGTYFIIGTVGNEKVHLPVIINK
jgi:hypothetical protein